MISLSQVFANSMPATLSLKTERLDSVAVDAVLNDAVGVGVVLATAAVVSARGAPRTRVRTSVYRIADIAKTPTSFELYLFSLAQRGFNKRMLTGSPRPNYC
jgi:hypothetical protein